MSKETVSQLENAIMEVCQSVGGTGVSFAELTRAIPGFEGDRGMINPEFYNIIFWHACSAEAIEALSNLLVSKKLIMRPTAFLIYMADGIVPNYPIARKQMQYKNVRWLPVVFDIATKKSKTIKQRGKLK